MKHIFSIEDLSARQIMRLLERSLEFKAGKKADFSDKKVMNLFFENSTRTKTSFQAAEINLGMKTLVFDAATSSVTKGESLYDTIKTIQSIGVDLAVIRHFEDAYYKELENIDMAIINGGDGKGQHPSQCLLDLLTIYEKFNHFEGLKVAIVGDLMHSRVAHSNSMALDKLGADLYFGGPKRWYAEEFEEFGPHKSIDELVDEMDVIMLLRVQQERMTGKLSLDDYLDEYGMTLERANRMKPTSIIMHPAPVNRGVEIADNVVECDKSVIFKQMTNGVFARMAMIEYVLNG